jgi:hypothetical protein
MDLRARLRVGYANGDGEVGSPEHCGPDHP